MGHGRRDGLPLTVIRPSWLSASATGRRVHRLVSRLRRGGVPLDRAGRQPPSAIYAGEVAEAAILAADDPGSEGEAYNVTDQGPITQNEYLALWAEACGAPPIRQRRRYPMVFAGAFFLEASARLTRQRRPPIITRYATWLMGREPLLQHREGRSKLGWTPRLTYREAIERTVRWYDGREPGRTLQASART